MKRSIIAIALLCGACAQRPTSGTVGAETHHQNGNNGGSGCNGGSGGGGSGGSGGGGGATCGNTICRGDQICVADQCTYACNGYRVPGDYANVSEAAAALKDVGGTICVAAQQSTEYVSQKITAPLTIIGAGWDTTRLGGVNIETSDSATSQGALTIEGLSLGYLVLNAHNVASHVIEGVRLEKAAETAGLYIDDVDHAPKYGTVTLRYSHLTPGHDLVIQPGWDLLVDGSELEFANIGIENRGGAPGQQYDVTMTIQNSFIHGITTLPGLQHLGYDVVTPNALLSLYNNTISGNLNFFGGSAVTWTTDFPVAVRDVNNLYLKNTLAIDDTNIDVLLNQNDALWGNTTNYAGGAIMGSRYVTADPQLDETLSPPLPAAASPLVGAADPHYLPVTDFWGRPRTSADIGAVQHQP